MKLIFHDLPSQDEGLNGYLLRLAEGNGYGGIEFMIRKNQISMKIFMEWLGVDKKCLQMLEVQLEGRRAAFFQLWNYKTSRYCPVCLRDSPIWRREWESTYLTVCPSHACYLVDRCDVCGKILTWDRQRLCFCDCGQQLNSASVQASHSEIILAKMLLSRILGRPVPEPFLSQLGHYQLVQLIHLLGVYSLPNESRRTQKIANMNTVEVLRPFVKEAADVLADWPNGFHKLLDRLNLFHASRTGKVGISTQYGHFYGYVFSRMKDREFLFLTKEFESHVVHSWLQPLTERNKRISPAARANTIWIPLIAAAEELGTSKHQLEHLFNAGLIDLNLRISDGGRKIFSIDRALLPKVRTLLDDLVDQETARHLLGIQKRRMQQLIKYRIVDVLTHPGNIGEKWGISRNSIHRILQMTDAIPKSKALPEKTIRMDFLMRYWLETESLFPELLRALSNQELHLISVAPEKSGIQGWMFEEASVKEWRDSQISRKRNGMLTIPQLAIEVGLKQEVAYHLVKTSMIKKSDVKGRGGTALIEREEINRFYEQYALSREFADMLGTSPNEAVRMLDRYGITPVCGKRIDGSPQYVYLRGPQLVQALDMFKTHSKTEL